MRPYVGGLVISFLGVLALLVPGLLVLVLVPVLGLHALGKPRHLVSPGVDHVQFALLTAWRDLYIIAVFSLLG